MIRLSRCVAVVGACAVLWGSLGVGSARAVSGDSLTQISPTAKSYVEAFNDPVAEVTTGDFAEMTYSPAGDVTAPVSAVDLVIPSPGRSNSGCDADDFVGFPAGSIALIQRGTCEFHRKAAHAAGAGAVAVIIFNEGDTPDRYAAFLGTLSLPGSSVPVVGTSFAVGSDLRNGVLDGPTGVVVRVDTDGQTPAPSPERDLDDFIAGVNAMSVPPATKHALASKLEAARAALQRGDTGAACNQLRAFEHSVEAQSGKKLTVEQAERLLAVSAELRDRIGC